jgi:hypothetical protein
MIDIIISFFTAIVIDTTVERDYKKIAFVYIKSYFFLDVIATLPGLCISENIEGGLGENYRKWTYYLKIIRYIHHHRINTSISDILKASKKYWVRNTIYIENAFSLFKYLLILFNSYVELLII